MPLSKLRRHSQGTWLIFNLLDFTDDIEALGKLLDVFPYKQTVGLTPTIFLFLKST